MLGAIINTGATSATCRSNSPNHPISRNVQSSATIVPTIPTTTSTTSRYANASTNSITTRIGGRTSQSVSTR